MIVEYLRSADAQEIGRRLQEARKARGRTQQEAAQELGVARTTITAIEKGERRVQPDELVRLASLYGRHINELVRQGDIVDAFTVQLRAPMAAKHVSLDTLASARSEFQRLCEDYLELERLCDAPLPRRYPVPYDYGALSPEAMAEDIAVSERNRLGLGDGPLLNLREVLENDVGLRIFYLPLPRGVAEMFAYTEQLGGCIAVNRNEPEERRRMSIAHAHGHFLTNRYQPEVCTTGVTRSSPHERFAGAFANAFLMPASGLTRRFHEFARRRSDGPTPADLLTLAHLYFVSPEALTRRLEDFRLVRSGTWEHLKISGLRVREALKLLGIESRHARSEALPVRYQYLALEAYARAEISEGQLARFLRTDRLEARRLVETLTSDIESAEGEPAAAVRLDLDDTLPVADA